MKLTQKEKARAFSELRRLLKGPHWEALNERRSELIDREHANAITPTSLLELEALQALAGLRRLTLSPYPTVVAVHKPRDCAMSSERGIFHATNRRSNVN